LNQAIHDIWLEFDADVLHLPIPVPGVFFNTGDDGSGARMGGSQGRQHCEFVLTNLLPRVQERPLSDSARQSVYRCFDELPEDGRIPFVALMMSRTRAGVRLMVSLPAGEVQGYLRRIGWRGPQEEAVRFLNEIAPLVDEFFVHLDVADRVAPRLGLECILHKRQPRIEPRWFSFLNHLVDVDLCSEASRDGLLAWPGSSHGVLPGEVVPSYLIRGISHVKIVVAEGAAPMAKGYLGFRRLYEDHYPEFQGESGAQEDS
jgi:hypothetical protein